MSDYLEASHFDNCGTSTSIQNALQIIPNNLVFDYVGVNQESDWQLVILKNNGYLPVNITGINVIGEFKVDGTINAVLDMNEQITIKVKYVQKNVNPNSGGLQIITTDKNNNFLPIIGGNGSRTLANKVLVSKADLEETVLNVVQDATNGLKGITQSVGTFLPSLVTTHSVPLSVTYVDRWARWCRVGDLVEGLGYISVSAISNHDIPDVVLRVDMSGMGFTTGVSGAYGHLLQKSYRLEWPYSSAGAEGSDPTFEIPPGGNWGKFNITFPKGNTFNVDTSFIKGASLAEPLILKWNWSIQL